MKNIKTTNQILLLLVVVIMIGISACQQKKKTLFEKIDVKQSTIDFSNRITENDTMNILDYEYIYNGGGVGIGDFNNDGLEDVYFAGNQVESKLYLNKGDFKFEDVTEISKTANADNWSSGVAVLDINADGKLDIYVCNTTYKNPAERVNSLFINQGVDENNVPVFKDMAVEYGLDDDSYSVNAVFFDYDNDNDLDMMIIINEFLGYSQYANTPRTKEQRKKEVQRVDRLYRNDFNEELGHAVFTNVSEEAGINIAGFSLGINICDLNKDGWKDIYITNDFMSNDILYINQQDGTFKNEEKKYLKHTSHSAMGNDVADINNDGYPEIVALDMLPENNYRQKKFLKGNNYTSYFNNNRFGYTFQYVRNTLQLNNGIDANHAPKFSEIALYSGISASDWSWTPMVVDFDNDMDRDIIVTNGFPKDVTDMDYVDYKATNFRFAPKSTLLSKIPSFKSRNMAFRNDGGLKFSDVGIEWGMEDISFSNGAAYADFDNDGDLDWVVNNIDDSAFLYKNNTSELHPEHNYLQIKLKGEGQNPAAFGAIVTAEVNGEQLFHEHTPFRGYLSTYSPVIHFGLGNNTTIPKVKVKWQDGKETIVENVKANQVIEIAYDQTAKTPSRSENETTATYFQADNTLNLGHEDYDFIDYNIQPLLPHKLSQYGPSMSVGDVNGDGLEDVYIGGAAFHHGYFVMQKADGSVQIDTFRGNPSRAEEMGTLLFDGDGDGDNDLFIVNGSYEFSAEDTILWDRYFENQNGNFVHQPNALPKYFSSGSCVKAADFDQDGDLDLFVGGRVNQGDYPLPTNSYLLQNNGGKFKVVNKDLIPDLMNIGLTSDALWTDFNQDGWMDLMILCEYQPIQFFENQQGKFQKLEPAGIDQKGFWNSITGADLDADGDIDYVLGNYGQNLYNQVSKEQPFRLYVNDFDKNKNSDMLSFAYFKDEKGKMREYPFMFREDFFKEVNAGRKMYPTYESYARAELKDIITKKTLKETAIYEINYTANSILWNEGNGNWRMDQMPKEAQLAPVYGTICQDFTGDGITDILLVGNDYGNEIFFGKLSGLNGLLLTGDGKQSFKSINTNQSGFYVPGDGKSLIQWKRPNGISILAGQNNDAILAYQPVQNASYFTPAPSDRMVVLETKGQKWLKELYYGNGFLSQSTRVVVIPKGSEIVEIIDYKGKRRNVKTRLQ
jgi:hypothetical protein